MSSLRAPPWGHILYMNSHASLVLLSSTRDRLKLVSFTGGISPVFLLDARTSEIDLNGTAQGQTTCPASLRSGRHALCEMECEIVSIFLFLTFSSCVGGSIIEVSSVSTSCNSPISSSDTFILCLNSSGCLNLYSSPRFLNRHRQVDRHEINKTQDTTPKAIVDPSSPELCLKI